MKILQIQTTTFDQRSIDLSLTGGLDLIYGPNEAGKSTIRGFLISSLCQPATGGGRRRAKTTQRQSQGKLRIVFAEGEVEVVFGGPTPTYVPSPAAQAFESARSSLDPQLYSMVYCIDSKEAATIAEMSDDRLQEFLGQLAIFGNFEEGAALRRLIDELKDRREKLFSPKANARNPAINRLGLDLRSLDKSLREDRRSVGEYEKKISQLNSVKDEIQQKSELLKEVEARIYLCKAITDLKVNAIEAESKRSNIPLLHLPESLPSLNAEISKIEAISQLQSQMHIKMTRRQEYAKDLERTDSEVIDGDRLELYSLLDTTPLYPLSQEIASLKDLQSDTVKEILSICQRLGIDRSEASNVGDLILTASTNIEVQELYSEAKGCIDQISILERELTSLGDTQNNLDACASLSQDIEKVQESIVALETLYTLKQQEIEAAKALRFPTTVVLVLMVLLVVSLIVQVSQRVIYGALATILALLLSLYLAWLAFQKTKRVEFKEELEAVQIYAGKQLSKSKLSSFEIENERRTKKDQLQELTGQLARVCEKVRRHEELASKITTYRERLNKLQSRIDEVFRHCGFNAKVNVEHAPLYLQNLAELKTLEARYNHNDELRAKKEDELTKTLSLASQLGFDTTYQDPSTLLVIDKKVDEILLKHHNALEKKAEYHSLIAQLDAEFSKDQNEVATLAEQAESYFKALGVEVQLNDEYSSKATVDRLKDIARNIVAYQELLARHETRLERLRSTYLSEEIDLLNALTPEELSQTLNELEGQRDELSSRLLELQNEQGGLNAEIRLAEELSPLTKEIGYFSKKEQLSNAVEEYLVLEATIRVLQEIKEYRERSSRPEVLDKASQIFETITQGRYRTIRTGDPQDGTLFVEAYPSNKRLTLRQLSTGTLEELALAIRLGYIETHGQNKFRYPIVLDDVFVNFDYLRTHAAMEALKDIAAQNDRQIIMLSCHERERELFRQITKREAAVIQAG